MLSMFNSKTTEFTKSIAIKPVKLKLIDKIKGKKSKAGKLDEIIEFYLQEKNLANSHLLIEK